MKTTILLLALCGAAQGAGLAAIKAEPNLEKRADQALAHANEMVDEARKDPTAAALGEIGESVDLCRDSLIGTGKSPRKSPKAFKKAELATRQIIRRLENLRQDLAATERAGVEKLIGHLHDVHDELLDGIMRKK